jgi:threonine aldolase
MNARSKTAAPDRFDCPDAIAGHGRPDPAAIYAAPGVFGAPRADVDLYGTGARLNAFEARIATLLGKDAAVFMPSGTMAQQIALRIVADRDGLRMFAAHPTNHLTPDWDELVAIVDHARERNWHVHLDGARLWESAPYYGRSYGEIAALFDSVYVSFYKGIGAIAGAMLCSSRPLIDEARIWQRRHGGNLMALYPYASVAEAAFDARISRMKAYRDAAGWLAKIVAAQPGTLRVQPLPPPTNMFHAYLTVRPDVLQRRVTAIARKHGVWTVLRTAATAIDGITKWEVSTGDATLALGPKRARVVLEALLGS